jgi:hypothetical protein
MKNFLLVVFISLFTAALAYAGTRAQDTNCGYPTTLADGGTTSGVSLSESTTCRMSVRVTDGGTINGGTLVSYYFDPVLGWVRSNTALDCVLEANKLVDAGAPAAQVCPDTNVLGRYGRVTVVGKSLVNGAGAAATATCRVECFSGTLP